MFVLWMVCQEKTHSGGGGLNSGHPGYPPPSALITALQRCQDPDYVDPLPERAEFVQMAHYSLLCRGDFQQSFLLNFLQDVWG